MLNALQLNELEEIETLALGTGDEVRFKIKTIDEANWAFRKLAALIAKEQEINSLANDERQRIADWEQKETASIQSSKDFFNSLLMIYASEQREVDPKFKTKTPYGSIGFTKQQDKWEYDDAKLVESLKSLDRNDLIRVKEEPNKVEIKKALSVNGEGMAVDPETGSVVEGISVTPQPEKINIKAEV